ncbi:hypothetical protein AVEN_161093-1 [Araneus ventricosus]|uniref:Uncharacterized protein n=1 Tax=Araneus ventricosus TaxID=182803 RepID=A0A4Y2W3G4_ARAVE|nr:hypothetical protein AVEN_161093-1 [Araneus ventricosus]
MASGTGTWGSVLSVTCEEKASCFKFSPGGKSCSYTPASEGRTFTESSKTRLRGENPLRMSVFESLDFHLARYPCWVTKLKCDREEEERAPQTVDLWGIESEAL